jgi:hypothetical protein
MSQRFVEIRGELFVTLETAAECYHVEARWLEEVHSRGLLARAERVTGSLAFPAAELDRLAAILRWHRHLGLDLDTVTALLAE